MRRSPTFSEDGPRFLSLLLFWPCSLPLGHCRAPGGNGLPLRSGPPALLDRPRPTVGLRLGFRSGPRVGPGLQPAPIKPLGFLARVSCGPGPRCLGPCRIVFFVMGFSADPVHSALGWLCCGRCCRWPTRWGPDRRMFVVAPALYEFAAARRRIVARILQLLVSVDLCTDFRYRAPRRCFARGKFCPDAAAFPQLPLSLLVSP